MKPQNRFIGLVCYGTTSGQLILMKHKEIGRQRGNDVVARYSRYYRGTDKSETWAASQLGQAFPSHTGKCPEELSKALLVTNTFFFAILLL